MNKVIVALDFKSAEDFNKALEDLRPYFSIFKVGLETVTHLGISQAVETVRAFDAKVFLDLKLHDIPNTMEGACKGLRNLNVDFFTVHASSGVEAMKRCAASKAKSKMLAVTVLTSLDDENCRHIYGDGVSEKVRSLAQDAWQGGAEGVVCSALELDIVRDLKLLKIVPGIRPEWTLAQDQKRTMTPKQALAAGADYLVIGRPLTQPPSNLSRKEAGIRLLEELA